MANLPPNDGQKQGRLYILIEAFRTIAKQYEWLVVFVFGGAIGVPLLLNEFLHDWLRSIIASAAVFIELTIIFSVWGLLQLISADRKNLLAYTAMKTQDEARSLGFSLYKQVYVSMTSQLRPDGSWTSYSKIEVAVVSDSGVNIIQHYNRSPMSQGKSFTGYRCTGRVTSIPDGFDWEFKYLMRGDAEPNAADIWFFFTPSLPRDAHVSYFYEQNYSYADPVFYEQVVAAMERRAIFRNEVRVIRGYRILCETDKISRKFIFPDGYQITDAKPSVTFRGVAVPNEVQRVSNTYLVRKVGSHWEILWEVDKPLVDHVYYFTWVPPKMEQFSFHPDMSGANQSSRE